jgi:hypothetical protein
MFKNLSLGVLLMACASWTAMARPECFLQSKGGYPCEDPDLIHHQGLIPHRAMQPTFKQAVETCAARVREETDDSAGGFSRSEFAAYVEPNGTVDFFGTGREHFRFDRCLHERGYTLHPISGGR